MTGYSLIRLQMSSSKIGQYGDEQLAISPFILYDGREDEDPDHF